MLCCTPAFLGRWSSRDFMRGRSKRAGAVHTRHTHGRQGRYKRLSTKYSSIRDGRRHASNHMQGGLGIKLGGGLFGLRIPRQHQLSHISREDFELEVYGHPNITNPYREHLDEHPDLKSVMMNAGVAVQMVVLMPRVARRTDSAGRGGTAPEKWVRVVREVEAALASLDPQPAPSASTTDAAAATMQLPSVTAGSSSHPVEIHFTTLETSACCRWPLTVSDAASTEAASAADAAASPPPTLAAHLESSVVQLYEAHCRLGHTLKLEKAGESKTAAAAAASPLSSSVGARAAHSLRRGRRPAVFMGAALKAPAGSSSSGSKSGVSGSASAGGSFTSSVLAQLTRDASAAAAASTALSIRPGAASQVAVLDEPTVPLTDGVASLVHRLTRTQRPTLRVCIRPSSSEAGSGAHDATSALTSAASPRRVLKADIDLNAEVGVWALPKSPLQELLRWHYCAHDPRAHNHDALPHHCRSLPLLLVVDYSTAGRIGTRGSFTVAQRRDGGAAASAADPTLMPRRLSLEMETAGFRVVQERTLRSVGEAIARWSPSAQWDRLTQSAATGGAREGKHQHHHHHHDLEGAACASC